MEFPPPLGPQGTPPALVPSDPASLNGILNRLERNAYELKFRGHSVPTRTITMIKLARQQSLSRHQMQRLHEVELHCKNFSRVIKRQAPELDPVQLQRDLREMTQKAADLRQEVFDMDRKMMSLEKVIERRRCKIEGLEERADDLKEHDLPRDSNAPDCAYDVDSILGMSLQERLDLAGCYDIQVQNVLKADFELKELLDRAIETKVENHRYLLSLDRSSASHRVFQAFLDSIALLDHAVLQLVAISTFERLQMLSKEAQSVEGLHSAPAGSDRYMSNGSLQSKAFQNCANHLRDAVAQFRGERNIAKSIDRYKEARQTILNYGFVSSECDMEA